MWASLFSGLFKALFSVLTDFYKRAEIKKQGKLEVKSEALDDVQEAKKKVDEKPKPITLDDTLDKL